MAEAQARKTYVLVHGAFHGGWCWRRVTDVLEAQGHKVFTPTLTGLGERAHLIGLNVNLTTHITDVVNVLKWEDLSEVVLCGHSYGGMVISGVAEQMRAAIASIVFLDAFIPENGDATATLTGQAMRDAIKAAQDKGEIALQPRPAEFFGVNTRDRAWVDSKLTPQSIATFTETIAITGAVQQIGRKTFIRAPSYENPGFDRALVRVRRDPAWIAYEAICGHDVMVDAPDWLAKILLGV
jgi:pimeloyl-ACP methyl ester carboxylesterase